MDEARLLMAAQAGDIDAFETLQEIMEPPIRRFVRRLLNSDYAVDDVVQDVFISLYYNMSRINPPENFRPYLYRMARNRCYDDMRKSQRTPTVSLDDEPVFLRVSFTESSHEPPPDEVTHWLLLNLEVQEAMDQLPEHQRQALILYAEEGLSYREIAEVMEVSLGTIKSRIYQAKQMLRRLLHPDTLAELDDEFDD